MNIEGGTRRKYATDRGGRDGVKVRERVNVGDRCHEGRRDFYVSEKDGVPETGLLKR